jgi:hypothetical protein
MDLTERLKHTQPANRSDERRQIQLCPAASRRDMDATIDFNITVELIGKTIKTFVP